MASTVVLDFNVEKTMLEFTSDRNMSWVTLPFWRPILELLGNMAKGNFGTGGEPASASVPEGMTPGDVTYSVIAGSPIDAPDEKDWLVLNRMIITVLTDHPGMTPQHIEFVLRLHKTMLWITPTSKHFIEGGKFIVPGDKRSSTVKAARYGIYATTDINDLCTSMIRDKFYTYGDAFDALAETGSESLLSSDITVE